MNIQIGSFSISLGGIFLILLCFGLFFKNRNSLVQLFQSFFSLSILFPILVNCGFAFRINDFQISYDYIFNIILLILDCLVIFVYSNRRLSSFLPISFILFILSVSLSSFFSFFSGKTFLSVSFSDTWDYYLGTYGKNLVPVSIDLGQFFGMFARCCIFLLNICVFKEIGNFNIFVPALANKIYRITPGFLVLSFIEMFCSNIISPTSFRSIVIGFFGGFDNTTYELPRQFFNIYMPSMAFREPSQMALCLFALLIGNLANYRLTKMPSVFLKRKITLYSLLLSLLFMSLNSMSSLLYFLCYVIVLFVNFNTKWKMIFTSIFSCAFICFVFLFFPRIESVVNYFPLFWQSNPHLLESRSELVRFYSAINNLQLFIQNPLFGCGLGSVYSYSGLFATLANIGIVGFFFWAKNLVSSIEKNFTKKTPLLFGMAILCLMFSFNGHIGELIYLDKTFYFFLMFVCLAPEKSLLPRKTQLTLYASLLSKKLSNITKGNK